jgi:hypothetical protein
MVENRPSTRNSIFVLPVLAVAGVLSSVFTLPFWFPFTSSGQSKYLFPALQSALLAVSACAVLWGTIPGVFCSGKQPISGVGHNHTVSQRGLGALRVTQHAGVERILHSKPPDSSNYPIRQHVVSGRSRLLLVQRRQAHFAQLQRCPRQCQPISGILYSKVSQFHPTIR